jgi:hypothetical protein
MQIDAHDKALLEAEKILRADPAASVALGAFRALLAQKPLKLLVVCVDPHTAIWTDDSVTATKLVAEPSNLLLEIVAAARAADWDKIVILVQGALTPVEQRQLAREKETADIQPS